MNFDEEKEIILENKTYTRVVCLYCKTNDELYRDYSSDNKDFQLDTYNCDVCGIENIPYTYLIEKTVTRQEKRMEVEDFSKMDKKRKKMIETSIQD